MESEKKDPFDIANACIDGRFNPDHPNISKIYTNTNLDLGPEHWRFKGWNPNFGNIDRYTLKQWIGSGRYSDVFDALQDGKTRCAIKLLKPVNTDRVRRELKIISEVQGHHTILGLMDIVIDNHEGIPSMVTEFCPNTPWRDLFTHMDLEDIRFYTYRVAQALAHTHSRGVMHRDVKPLNILCANPRAEVKLADWGLAEFYHPMRKYSTHVATKYYKSPEILLGYEYYDYSLDVWSLGVTLLEMLSLKMHAFDAENNDFQIDEIATGTGGAAIVEWASKYRVKLSGQDKLRLLDIRPTPWREWIPKNRKQFADEQALDLLDKMLTVDHKEGITAQEVCQHPFFEIVRQYDVEHNIGQ